MRKLSFAGGILGAAGSAGAAGSTRATGNVGVGLLVMALVVALGFLVRWIVVKMTHSPPDTFDDPIEFDKFTRSSDRPSIERY